MKMNSALKDIERKLSPKKSGYTEGYLAKSKVPTFKYNLNAPKHGNSVRYKTG